MTHKWHQRMSRRDVMTSTKCRFFKINFMLTQKCARMARINARARFIKLVHAVSNWIHRSLVFYQVGCSIFLSNYPLWCRLFFFTWRSAALGYFRLPFAATVLLGASRRSSSTHTFGRVSQQPEQLRRKRQRNVRPVCGGGERHLPQQKRCVSLSAVLRRVSYWCSFGNPEWFLLRQLANWTSVWDIVFRPRWSPMRNPFNKGNVSQCLDVETSMSHLVWTVNKTDIFFLDYAATFWQSSKASKVNVL